MIQCFGIFACGLAGFSPTLPPSPPAYVIEGEYPTQLPALLDAAFMDSGPMGCPVTITVEGNRSVALSDGDQVCAIRYAPKDLETGSVDWWAPWVVRHEIAHLLNRTNVGDGAHGPKFRVVLNRLLAPIGLREVYGPVGEYPVEMWRDGVNLLAGISLNP